MMKTKNRRNKSDNKSHFLTWKQRKDIQIFLANIDINTSLREAKWRDFEATVEWPEKTVDKG